MNKKVSLSTELFKDKVVPNFIRDHFLFKNPTLVSKIFPSIGLPNFSEKANIDKCFTDVRKEGSYVYNLLSVMAKIIGDTRDDLNNRADKLQFLSPKEERENTRQLRADIYEFVNILNALECYMDPSQRNVISEAISISEGKVNLKLIENIVNYDGKIIFRKGDSLFKVFSKIYEKCPEMGVAVVPLDQTNEFKIFSKENVPNKSYQVVFSSNGPDGAWDILTMSMRGIKSCQRWDGEYPRCLIGSILSKYVGIIYLTSGVKADDQGVFTNLGSKMIKRCVVRYAIDSDGGSPCILIDKMYPDLDRDILNVFVNTLKSKTKLPIYYAQELGQKLKYVYSPTEKIREEIQARELSYQDTPLKSKNDIDIYVLNNNKDEIEKELKGFGVNFSLALSRKMDDIYNNNIYTSDGVKYILSNIRMSMPFTTICDQIATTIIASFRAPPSKTFTNSKFYYKKYLMEFFLKRKQTFALCNSALYILLSQFSSQADNVNSLMELIMKWSTEFAKKEITKVVV